MSAAVETGSILKSIVSQSGFSAESHPSVLAALNLCYKMLCQCADESSAAVEKFSKWSVVQFEKYKGISENDKKRDAERAVEKEGMSQNDTIGAGLKRSLGPHLQPLSKSESRARISARFDGVDLVDMSPHLVKEPHPEVTDFETASDLMDYCDKLLKCIRANGEKVRTCDSRSDELRKPPSFLTP